MDEDEPLNLSTKSNRTNSNAIIWSPASLCEKESSNTENVSIKTECLDELGKAQLSPNINQMLLNVNNQLATQALSSASSSSLSSNSSNSSTSLSIKPRVALMQHHQEQLLSALEYERCRLNLQRNSGNGGNGDLAGNHFGLKNKIDFPSTLTQAAAAAAAAAVQAATNTTEFFSHLHKQAEFDLIAKNHLDLFKINNIANNINSNHINNNNNDNTNNNNNNSNNNNKNTANATNKHSKINNNNDDTINNANKDSNANTKSLLNKSDGPKNSRSIEHNRIQKLFQVSFHFPFLLLIRFFY